MRQHEILMLVFMLICVYRDSIILLALRSTFLYPSLLSIYVQAQILFVTVGCLFIPLGKDKTRGSR